MYHFCSCLIYYLPDFPVRICFWVHLKAYLSIVTALVTFFTIFSILSCCSSIVPPDIEFITILLYLSYFLVLGSLHSGFYFTHSLICLMFLNATFFIAFMIKGLSSVSFIHSSLSLIYNVSRFESLQCIGLL